MAQSRGDQALIDSMFYKKTVLSDLQEMKAQCALIRSCFKNVQQMDVPSKYFFGLDKKDGQKRFIHSLISETGSLLSTPPQKNKRESSWFL